MLENIKANTSSNESFCDHPYEVASPLHEHVLLLLCLPSEFDLNLFFIIF